MTVFFPFGIPTTSSFASSAQIALTIDAPPGYTAPYADRALYAPAGSPGVNAVNCPPGYENALNPSDPINYPPVPSQVIDRSGYLLCFPTGSVTPPTTPSPTPTVTPTITPTVTPTSTPAATPAACYSSAFQVRINADNICSATNPFVYIGTNNPSGNITTGGYVYYTTSGCGTLINNTSYDDGSTIYVFDTNGTLSSTTPCSTP